MTPAQGSGHSVSQPGPICWGLPDVGSVKLQRTRIIRNSGERYIQPELAVGWGRLTCSDWKIQTISRPKAFEWGLLRNPASAPGPPPLSVAPGEVLLSPALGSEF